MLRYSHDFCGVAWTWRSGVLSCKDVDDLFLDFETYVWSRIVVTDNEEHLHDACHKRRRWGKKTRALCVDRVTAAGGPRSTKVLASGDAGLEKRVPGGWRRYVPYEC